MENDNRIQSRLLRTLHWPVYLLPLLVVLTAVVFFINFYAGIAAAVFCLFYLVFSLWWLFYWKRQTEGELVEFAESFNERQREQLLNLPVPYAILGPAGELIWANRSFEELMPEELGDDECVKQMLPSLGKDLPDDDTRRREHIRWRDRAYQAELQMVSGDSGMYSLFLFDETSHLEALAEIEEQKGVIGQIYIDNYDDAMNSAETVRQSLLTALIERKISKYFAGYDGIVRKMEKDKFFVFLKKKGLVAIQEDRFSLLEDVKTLNIGNSIAITLSISMGCDGATMEQNNEFSRTAMDLALGRGGDQAIVKTPDSVRYYGGKTQQQERNTRVKARVKAQALRELMLTRDQVLIMGHRIPDMDAFGAAVGIFRAARTLDKQAHIVMDQVTSSLRPIVNRFKNNSDYPADMMIDSERARTILDGNTMVIVVDVNRPSYTECPALLERASTIVVLDHHRQGGETVRRATLSYIEPYASSASEMVAEILQYFDDATKLRPIEAEALYAGMVVDTQNFMSKTGVRTFEAAAFLRRHGADVMRVRKLFRERLSDSKAKAQAVSSAELFEGCFALGVCPSEGIESPTVVGAQAANELLDVIGVKASFVFTEYNGTIYISARSIDEVNVQLIMERLGGGGHLSIAGAQLTGRSIGETKRLLKDTLRQMLREGAI